MKYSKTTYFKNGGEITDEEWANKSFHTCPECNPSDHVKSKRGVYACMGCGRLWKNIFEDVEE